MSNPYASDINTTQIGRFSSTLLNQSGARRVVRNVGGTVTTTYGLRKGTESSPSAPSVSLSDLSLTTGSLHENTYTAILGFFQSRGATLSNASTMAALVIDTAKLNNVSPMSLLTSFSKTSLNPDAYLSINILRNVGDQQELVSSIRNSQSFKSSSIKA